MGERKGACKLKIKCFLCDNKGVELGKIDKATRWYKTLPIYIFLFNHQCTMLNITEATSEITHNMFHYKQNLHHQPNSKNYFCQECPFKKIN